MHPKSLLIEDFDYDLPDEKIAKHPLQKRDESKLLIYNKKIIAEDIYRNISTHLQSNSLLIFNNTKVVEARLLFKKSSGTTIEIFCLEPGDEYADITTAMLRSKKAQWKCLVGNAKKWKDELLTKDFDFEGKQQTLTAKKIEKRTDHFIIEFFWNDDISFSEVLHANGVIPLPPYLHRNAEKDDAERYQTVYAKHDGSVAAPTAGLHFTDEIFKQLSLKNIDKDFVTLHVGAGTFKPVKTTTIEQHEMHSEFFEADKRLIENIIQNLDNNIVAVGTTSLRTIESLYWMGRKIIENEKLKIENYSIEDISIKQWDAYEMDNGKLTIDNISVKESLEALLKWMHQHYQTKLIAKTQILIAPPYKLKVANALITNFHQPKSTLLLLIAAVVGDKWKHIYNYALKNNFRFLSYGDGCLLFT